MARVTVEDCLEKVGNHFALVVLASTRARQIERGSKALVPSENRFAVTALREISQGKVFFEESLQTRLEDYLYALKQRGANDSLSFQSEFSTSSEPQKLSHVKSDISEPTFEESSSYEEVDDDMA